MGFGNTNLDNRMSHLLTGRIPYPFYGELYLGVLCGLG
jgi:hypothetical protein